MCLCVFVFVCVCVQDEDVKPEINNTGGPQEDSESESEEEEDRPTKLVTETVELTVRAAIRWVGHSCIHTFRQYTRTHACAHTRTHTNEAGCLTAFCR